YATQAYSYKINLYVSDGNRRSSEAVTVEIAPQNGAPVFVPMVSQVGRGRAEMRFTVVADDPDRDAVVLSLISPLPEGAAFSAERGEFVWIPGYDQTGTYTLTFAAQDGSGASDTLDVEIIIADVNRAPEMKVSDRAF